MESHNSHSDEDALWNEVEQSLFEYYMEKGLANAASKARAKTINYMQLFKDRYSIVKKEKSKIESV